jgi:hypothetical protein
MIDIILVAVLLCVLGGALYALVTNDSCPYRWNYEICKDCPLEGTDKCK